MYDTGGIIEQSGGRARNPNDISPLQPAVAVYGNRWLELQNTLGLHNPQNAGVILVESRT